MPARGRSDCDLGDLDRLSRSALRHLWRQQFGGEPPSSFGGDLLALAIAHARQERQYGGMHGRRKSALNASNLKLLAGRRAAVADWRLG